MTKKKKGGFRGGIKPHGRTTDRPKKNRSIKWDDIEWAEIQAFAKARGVSASDHVRRAEKFYRDRLNDDPPME